MDLLTYQGWLEATLSEDSHKAEYYHARFRPEFRPIFETWLGQDPMNNSGAPPSPFALPEHRVTLEQRSAELRAQADATLTDASAFSETDEADDRDLGNVCGHRLVAIILLPLA